MQGHFVHFGYKLPFGHYGVVIGIQLVDDAADLCTYFHFGHRFDGACGGHGVGDVGASHGGCLVCHFPVFGLSAQCPDSYAGHDDGSSCYDDNLLLAHTLL